MLGAGLGGGAERPLTDDVEPHPAVLDLAGLIPGDPDLLAQLPRDVDRAGVVEVQSQRHHVGLVRGGRGLSGVRHDDDARGLLCHLLQLGDGGVHIVVAGVGAGRGDQRQRGGTLLGEVVFELVLHVQ